MSLFTCNFFSKILMTPTRVLNVCLPSSGSSETLTQSLDMLYAKREPLRALYLLHGMNGTRAPGCARPTSSATPSATISRSSCRTGRTAFTLTWRTARSGLLISPRSSRSIGASFPVSSRREDTYIAGLSMGGYGAFKAAMTYPQRYAAFGSFSGALDIEAVAAAAKGQGLERQGHRTSLAGSPSP